MHTFGWIIRLCYFGGSFVDSSNLNREAAEGKAAELKLKTQVEGSIAQEDGLSGKNAKPLTDAALFKMAYKSQQADLKKKDAAVETRENREAHWPTHSVDMGEPEVGVRNEQNVSMHELPLIRLLFFFVSSLTLIC